MDIVNSSSFLCSSPLSFKHICCAILGCISHGSFSRIIGECLESFASCVGHQPVNRVSSTPVRRSGKSLYLELRL